MRNGRQRVKFVACTLLEYGTVLFHMVDFVLCTKSLGCVCVYSVYRQATRRFVAVNIMCICTVHSTN